MEKICRFCLKVSIKNMCSLQECDILYNIQKFLTLNIPTEDSLPSNLCKECFIKVSQIIKFCLTVKDNEDKLQYYSRNGLLEDYYSKITSYKQTIDERKELKIETQYEKAGDDTKSEFEDYDNSANEELFDDNLKNEEMSDDYLENEELSDDNLKNEELSDDNLKNEEMSDDYLENEEFSDNNLKNEEMSDGYLAIEELSDDNLKNEELSYDIYKTHCSFDNEITLSSINKEKEINTPAPLKKITKFKALKSIIPKRKNKKKEPEYIEYVKPFTCLSCLIECDSKANLKKHYYAEHYKEQTGHTNFTEHKSENKTMYSCNSCEKTCNLKKDIVKHIMSHTNDSDERSLICKICARTYRRVPDIVRHARAHSGLKLQCPYDCGYTTAYQGAMKEHKQRHLDEYKYTCKTCGKGFNTKTWYEQHQNLHTGQKPFVCNVCGDAFALSRYLHSHKIRKHTQMSSLKRYQCVHCDEKCVSTKTLALHLKKHGINKENGSLCDFCGKMCVSASQLAYHHRIHLGVKPYSCKICKKKFAKKYNVQLHMVTHTREKSHVCSYCGQQFTQRSTMLKHHRRSHGGDTSP